jgi:two-component system alkaline phosphatase synthesis response regulator PhoP
MDQPTVLVVDDESKIRAIVRDNLQAAGFTVTEQADGPGALDAARRDRPDLIILDIMLPGLDGIEVLRRLRETSQVPVILLTARARVILRRASHAPGPQASEPIRHGQLTINPGRREVTTPSRPASLTALDFDLLLALARHPGQVLTRSQLLQTVWGPDYYGDDRVVDVHIRTLRKALGDDASNPAYIATIRSIGYRFIAPTPA